MGYTVLISLSLILFNIPPLSSWSLCLWRLRHRVKCHSGFGSGSTQNVPATAAPAPHQWISQGYVCYAVFFMGLWWLSEAKMGIGKLSLFDPVGHALAHGWRRPPGKCARWHTNLASIAPTFLPLRLSPALPSLKPILSPFSSWFVWSNLNVSLVFENISYFAYIELTWEHWIGRCPISPTLE